MLNKKDLQEAISAARLHTILPEAVIEKDYYVTRAISILSQLDYPHFKLIFSGGTSLAKAHKAINRMSEDIDFKIQLIDSQSDFSRSKLKNEIKAFRAYILSTLKDSEFKFNENDINIKNEGKYISLHLTYPSTFTKAAGLRPQLLLEFTLSEPREQSAEKHISTLIQEILGDIENLEQCKLPCLSVSETLSEKWVGLTRRVAAIKRGYLKEDDYLIRHLYDITIINYHNQLEKQFYTLAKDVLQQDAEQFKTQHPEYHANPSNEINHSIKLLETDPYWKSCYENFVDIMVFDSNKHLKFNDALLILKEISGEVI